MKPLFIEFPNMNGLLFSINIYQLTAILEEGDHRMVRTTDGKEYNTLWTYKQLKELVSGASQ